MPCLSVALSPGCLASSPALGSGVGPCHSQGRPVGFLFPLMTQSLIRHHLAFILLSELFLLSTEGLAPNVGRGEIRDVHQPSSRDPFPRSKLPSWVAQRPARRSQDGDEALGPGREEGKVARCSLHSLASRSLWTRASPFPELSFPLFGICQVCTQNCSLSPKSIYATNIYLS